MHLSRGVHEQRPLTCGPSGWLVDQIPWPIGPTLQHLMSFLGGDALQEAVEGNRGLESVEAALHGRPANTGQFIDLTKSVIAHGTPINTPLSMEFTHTTLYL
jgi:hypothetical protein